MKKYLLLPIIALASMSVFALNSDKDQPIEIRADKFNGDGVKQTAIYTGNVIVTQGTMSLTGNKLELKITPKGYRQATVSGKLAKFRQQKSNDDKKPEEWIHAQADSIQYDEEKDVITLTGKAKLSRSENGIEKDVTQGSRIVYDLRKAKSIVEGGSNERVTTIIAPRTKASSKATPDLSTTSDFSVKK